MWAGPSAGDWRAGSIEIGGDLRMMGGSLRLVDASATSEAGGVVLEHARLGVAGVLEIAGGLQFGAGAHLAGGYIDLGVASKSRLTGGEGATLPKPASHGGRGKLAASPTPCGPYSPLASRACGTRDRAALADVRVTWARFVGLLDSRAKPEQVAGLLLPGRWDAEGGGATTDLIEVAKQARRLAHSGPLSPLLIVGDRAYGFADPKGHIEFARAGDAWLVAGF